MSENLLLSLQISLIGLAFVFLGMLLLWILMAILVRIPQGKERGSAQENEIDLRAKAALAAVMIALEHQVRGEPRLFPLPPTSSVSPWQAVTRASRLGRRAHPTGRGSR
jgi:hypothetical protein